MDIPLHKDAMMMLLTRGNEKYVPHGDTYLKVRGRYYAYSEQALQRNIE